MALNHKLNVSYLCIDGTLVQSFAFHEMTGFSGYHNKTGVKLSAAVEGNGLPIGVQFASGNTHDIVLAEQTIATMYVSPRRARSILLADRGYDGAHFRYFCRQKGIRTNIAKRISPDGVFRETDPPYNKNLGKSRFIVERTNAWLKDFRRLRFRYDYTMRSFRAFVYMAILVLCVRKLIS